MFAPIKLTQRFTVSGDSMLPLLEPGDEVWVRPQAKSEPGALMVYARFNGREPSLVVHRLLGRFLTRGDSSLHKDPPQEAGDFLGQVVAFKRGNAVVDLDSFRGKILNHFCRLYARIVLCRWSGLKNGVLRAVALAPARLVYSLLYPRF